MMQQNEKQDWSLVVQLLNADVVTEDCGKSVLRAHVHNKSSLVERKQKSMHGFCCSK